MTAPAHPHCDLAADTAETTAGGYQDPSAEFWEENRRYVKLDTDGHLYLTPEGRQVYGPLFAKWGYALESPTTRERFRRVLLSVTALELEENTRALRQALADPRTSDAERKMLRELLGEPQACDLEPSQAVPAQVQESPATPAGGNIVHVHFGTRRGR